MEGVYKSIVNSKYYKDTGKRAKENAELLRNGLTVPGEQKTDGLGKTKTVETPLKVDGNRVYKSSSDNEELVEKMNREKTIQNINKINVLSGEEKVKESDRTIELEDDRNAHQKKARR